MVKTFYMVLVLNRVFGLLISKLGNGNTMDVDLLVPSFDYYQNFETPCPKFMCILTFDYPLEVRLL